MNWFRLNEVDKFLFSEDADIIFEKLWMQKLKRQIDQSVNRFNENRIKFSNWIDEYIKNNKINNEELIKINLYWLSKRWDEIWKIKIFTYLTKIWDPLKQIENKGIIKLFLYQNKPIKDEKNINEMIYEYGLDSYINIRQKKLYYLMRKKLEEIHKYVMLIMLKENKWIVRNIENFRPIVIDRKLSKTTSEELDYNIENLQESYIRRNKTKHTINKEITKEETIPLMRADQVFQETIRSILYYHDLHEVIVKLTKVVEALWENTLWKLWYDYFMNSKKWYINVLTKRGKNG